MMHWVSVPLFTPFSSYRNGKRLRLRMRKQKCVIGALCNGDLYAWRVCSNSPHSSSEIRQHRILNKKYISTE